MENFWFDFMDNMSLYEKVFEFVLNKVGKDSPKMSEQLSKLMERKVCISYSFCGEAGWFPFIFSSFLPLFFFCCLRDVDLG